MTTQYPRFLKHADTRASARKKVADIHANWERLSKVINEISEEEVLTLFVLEIEGPQRMHIFERLFRRLDRLRRSREEHEVRAACVYVRDHRDDA